MKSSQVDKYGFICDNPSQISTKEAQKEQHQIQEWDFIMKNWTQQLSLRFDQIKSRVRKGIPNSIRGQLWYLISGAEVFKSNYPENYYQTLLTIDVNTEVENDISADIGRTFPNHTKFQTKKGRRSLSRILKAYSLFDREVGYTQGMAFIAASFLMHLSEEDSFWLFASVMTQYNFRECFILKMPKVEESFYIVNGLMRHYLSGLWNYFKNVDINVSMFATQWFMTGYNVGFKYETAARVWDCFLFEGEKIFFRVFLGVLKLHRSSLNKQSFENAMEVIRGIGNRTETELLLKTAFKFSLSKKLIERLRSDYKNNPKPKYLIGINRKSR